MRLWGLINQSEEADTQPCGSGYLRGNGSTRCRSRLPGVIAPALERPGSAEDLLRPREAVTSREVDCRGLDRGPAAYIHSLHKGLLITTAPGLVHLTFSGGYKSLPRYLAPPWTSLKACMLLGASPPNGHGPEHLRPGCHQCALHGPSRSPAHFRRTRPLHFALANFVQQTHYLYCRTKPTRRCLSL